MIHYLINSLVSNYHPLSLRSDVCQFWKRRTTNNLTMYFKSGLIACATSDHTGTTLLSSLAYPPRFSENHFHTFGILPRFQRRRAGSGVSLAMSVGGGGRSVNYHSIGVCFLLITEDCDQSSATLDDVIPFTVGLMVPRIYTTVA